MDLSYWKNPTVLIAAALFVATVQSGCDDDASETKPSGVAHLSTEQSRTETEPSNVEPEPRELDLPAARGASDVRLFEADGGFGMSWLEPVDDPEPDADGVDLHEGRQFHGLKVAEWRGSNWTEPQLVIEDVDLAGNRSVVCSDSSSYLAHWQHRSDELNEAATPRIGWSTDAGETWETFGSERADTAPPRRDFVSLTPSAIGTLVTWLEGPRKMDQQRRRGPMTLRATALDDEEPSRETLDATFFSHDGGAVLDDRVSGCSSPDVVALRDSVLVAYRNLSEQNVREIYTVRRVDGTWKEPTRLGDDGWQSKGCPQAGPAVAAEGSTVAIAWYTYADEDGRLKLAISSDGGNTFRGPYRVVDGDEDGGPVDYVDVAVVDGEAVVAWHRAPGEQYEAPQAILDWLDPPVVPIQIRRVSQSGTVGAAETVGETGCRRHLKTPRILRFAGQAVVAWQDTRDETPLRAKAYPLSAIPEPTPP